MNKNNFDVLRFGSALAVLISHAVPLSYGNGDRELIALLSHDQVTAGSSAVAIFFVTSGYLITESWDRKPQWRRFIWARFLRIYPAFLLTVIITTLVGSLVSTLSPSTYFSDLRTWTYFLTNLSLLRSAHELPGVFTNLPYPKVVNGSLWTLTFEARCYFGVLVLGKVGLLNRWFLLAAWTAGCVSQVFWWGGAMANLGTLFLAGAVLQKWRVPMDGRLALLCLCVVLGALLTTGLRLALPSAGAYLVIYAALGLRPLLKTKRADLSYGTYLWAFPIQQCVTAALGPSASWALNVTLSIPIVLGISWLSWHCVEAPALSLKDRMPFRRIASPEEAAH